MTTERAFFRVVGMYCTSCKSIVEKQLKDEKGVIKVDINYMTDSVIVDFNPNTSYERKDKEHTREIRVQFCSSCSINR